MSNGYEVMADPTANLSRRAVVGDFGPRELVSLSKQASPQTRYQSSGGYKIGEELGRSGLRHWGGFVFEEWLRELQQGRRAAEVYRDMMDSDAIVGSIMYLIQTLIRRVTWRVEPGDSSRAAQQGADWYWSVLNDMRWSWTDTVGEIICFLGYGYSYLEEVYKYRRGENRDPVRSSTSTDGTIGLAKLGLRAQDALWKWVFDDNGEIEGMIQNPPPDYLLRYVPMEKALLFRTTIFKNNPEGRSVLRSAYRSWYMAKNFQNIEGIGLERDLAGLPVLKPPPEIDLWNPNDPTTAPLQAMAQNMVSSIRRDEQEGIIVPYGWELELLTTGGRRQFDVGAIITRYETRMAMTTLADIVMLGQNSVGSYALSVTKKDMLAMSLGGHLDIIASQHNSDQIPRLWRLNGFTWPQPKLVHGTVESIDLDTLGNYLMRLAQGGAPIDWSNVLEWSMQMAGAPKPSPGHDFSPRTPMSATTSDAGPSRGPLANSSPIAKEQDFERWREYAWEGM